MENKIDFSVKFISKYTFFHPVNPEFLSRQIKHVIKKIQCCIIPMLIRMTNIIRWKETNRNPALPSQMRYSTVNTRVCSNLASSDKTEVNSGLLHEFENIFSIPLSSEQRTHLSMR